MIRIAVPVPPAAGCQGRAGRSAPRYGQARRRAPDRPCIEKM